MLKREIRNLPQKAAYRFRRCSALRGVVPAFTKTVLPGSSASDPAIVEEFHGQLKLHASIMTWLIRSSLEVALHVPSLALGVGGGSIRLSHQGHCLIITNVLYVVVLLSWMSPICTC